MAAPGKEIHMTVKENVEVISGKIKSFVDAYNAALQFIQKQNTLQAKEGSKNPSLGPLGGDGMLRTIESDLRSAILNPVNGVETPIKRLSEIGIEFNRNGSLDFSQDKFNKVLNSNPAGVAAFLRGDGFNTGFITGLKSHINNLLQMPYGVIGNRKKGLDDRITQINSRIDMKERQLEKKEDSLHQKFANLEQKMSEMQAQQAKFAAMSRGG
jgi:flagellar hook-associated protein 2